MKTARLLATAMVLLLSVRLAHAQQLRLGYNPYTVEKSAVLELMSDKQGLLLPRIADTTLINALTPPDGMMIYSTVAKQILVRANGYWQALAPSTATIRSLNGLTGNTQTFATGTSGTDFSISSSGAVHTFNIPDAGASARGLITTGAQTVAGSKTFSSAPLFSSLTAGSIPFIGAGGLLSQNNANLFWDATNNRLGIGTNAPSTALHLSASNGNVLYLQTLQGGGTGTAGILFKTYTGVANPTAQVGVTDDGSYSSHITFSTKTPGADANTLAERVRISSAGNVGIGTTTPSRKLDVNGAIVSSATSYPNYAYNSANRMAFGESNVPANETGSVVQFGSGSNTRNMLFAFTKTNVNTSYLGNDGTQMMFGSESTIPITFRTGLVYTSANVMGSGTEVMRLTSAGQLGIGTTTPSSALHVVGTNPLTLVGVQAGTSTSADSLLTITSGVVRKLPMSTFAPTFTTGNLTETGSGILTITGGTNAVTGSGTTIQVKQASGSQNGFLSSADWSAFNSKLSSVDTGNISNFYLKVRSEHTAGAGISYNSSTGVIANSGVLSVNGNTGALTMDTGYITNFYQKTRSLFSGVAPITYNTNGQIGITQASASTNGYLSSTDWNTFNNKAAAFTTGNLTETVSGVLTIAGGTNAVAGSGTTIQVKQASGSQNGFLSSADWNTFNNKLSAIDTTNISNFYLKVRGEHTAGSGISYNSTTGVIGNSGVLSVNGNTGALTMDTGYISNFYQKSRGLLSAGTGISYNATTGVISSAINTANFWSLGGNAVAGTQNFGTTSNYDLPFITNNTERMRITSAGDIGIGVTNPTNPLVVKDTLEIRRTGALSELLFSNTAGAGDFRIGGDGGDIFWQGGGGRNLQMGAYWGIVLAGDRQTGTFPSFSAGVANTGVLAQAQRDASVPLAIQANSATQSANLTEWRSSTGTALSVMDKSGSMGIGTASFNSSNPEKLVVDAGTTSSVNAIVGRGTVNNYLQLNIQNLSSGASASSDVVATADNGSESTNYVDMGINSSGNTNNYFGAANDAYLYNLGQNLLIGTGTAGKNLVFMTGGGTQSTNERMRIDGTGVVGIATNSPNSSTKLDVNGAVKLGAKGTVEKNVISFTVSFASNTTVPGASMNVLASTYSPGALDYSATIPAANTPTTTQGSVSISTDQDLPANVSIAWSRVSATSTVKVHFLNGSTSNQTIPSGLKLYITITEF